MLNPKLTVKNGYDKVSEAYREDDSPLSNTGYEECLNLLTPSLQKGCRVLDLGCGCGVPVARCLAKDYDVTGIDLSGIQIERGRNLVPKATFICADMTEHHFEDGSFDVIVSFYAIIHVPLAEQLSLLEKIRRWLIPGGLLLLTVGKEAWTGYEDNWCGVQGAMMYWSQADRDTYETWLLDLEFEIIEDIFVPERESDGHHTFLARNSLSR